MKLDRNPIPKFYQLKELLAREIREGNMSVGDRLPSINILASQFKISRTTAARALALLQEEGLVDVGHGRGTIVISQDMGIAAQPSYDTVEKSAEQTEALSQRSWKKVFSDRSVLLTGTTLPLSHDDFGSGDATGRITIALENSLMIDGDRDHLVFAELHGQPLISSDELKELQSRSNICGIIANYSPLTRADALEGDNMVFKLIQETKLPIVLLLGSSAAEGVCSVSVDNCGMMMPVVRYLESLGHRKILFVGAKREVLWSRERVSGFQRAMDLYGLPCSSENIAYAPRDDKISATPVDEWADRSYASIKEKLLHAHFWGLPGDIWVNRGYASAIEKLSLGQFSAVVAINDAAAAGVLRAAEELGLSVPDDLSVIGIDDNTRYRHLNLTTVRLPYETIAVTSLELLAGQITGSSQITQIILRPQLIIRGTTGSCRK